MKFTRFFHLSFLVVLCTLCYWNALDCGFAFDDKPAIVENNDLRPTTPITSIFLNNFWGKPMIEESSHGSYRPLCVLTFRLNYIFSQLEPKSYHFLNLILHAFVTLLLYWTLLKVQFSRFQAWVSSVLFAVHPIHTEVVTGIVGRADLMSAICFLLAIIFYADSANSRGPKKVAFLALVIVLIPAASLSKETGVTVAGVLVVYEIFCVANLKLNLASIEELLLLNRASICRLIGLTVATVSFLIVRLQIMPRKPHFLPSTNPAANSPAPIRQLTFAYLIPLNAQLLLHPWRLLCDYTLETVPLIGGWTDPRNAVTILFFASFILATLQALASIDRQVIFSLACLVIPFIPSSNAFFPVGFVLAERVLYLPSIGWCALVAIGLQRFGTSPFSIGPSSRTVDLVKMLILKIGLLIIVTAFLARSFKRNYAWTDDLTLFRAGIHFNEKSSQFYHFVGHTLEKQGRFDEAFAYNYYTARKHPKNYMPHRELGRLLEKMVQRDFSLRAYRRLVAVFPIGQKPVDFEIITACSEFAVRLANSSSTSKLIEAVSVLELLIDHIDGFSPAYQLRGDLLYKLGRYDEAREMYEKLQCSKPLKRCADASYNMAVLEVTQARDNDKSILAALKLFERSVELDRGHYYSMHAYSSIVQAKRFVKFYGQAIDFIESVLEAEKRGRTRIIRNPGFSITIPESLSTFWDPLLISAALEQEAAKNSLKAFERFLQALQRLDSEVVEPVIGVAKLLPPNEAAAKLEAFLETSPNNTNAWFVLGFIHATYTKNYASAKLAYENSLERALQNSEDPRIIKLQIAICRLFKVQGQHEKAAECFTKLTQQYPDNNNLFEKDISE